MPGSNSFSINPELNSEPILAFPKTVSKGTFNNFTNSNPSLGINLNTNTMFGTIPYKFDINNVQGTTSTVTSSDQIKPDYTRDVSSHFDHDTQLRKMYGEKASRRDKRRFEKYWNSEERIKNDMQLRDKLYQQYLSNYKSYWDNKLTPKTSTQTTTSNNAKTSYNLPYSEYWTKVAKKWGFASMDDVAEWQKQNGLVVDGKFGKNSMTKYNQLKSNEKQPAATTSQKTSVPVTRKVSVNQTSAPVSAKPAFTVDAFAYDNDLPTTSIDGKLYARYDPQGIGDFWVGENGKVFYAGPFGSLGREVSENDFEQNSAKGNHYNRLKNQLVSYTPSSEAANKFKKGGIMNRINYFQQGGATPQQDLKAQITALVQAAMQGDQKATQQVNQIMEAAKAGDQQAMQIAQIMEQVVKELQGQATVAKWGAKLGYIRSLKYGNGGKTCPACKKGGIPETSDKAYIKTSKKVEEKACGGKAKKKYFGGLI